MFFAESKSPARGAGRREGRMNSSTEKPHARGGACGGICGRTGQSGTERSDRSGRSVRFGQLSKAFAAT